MPLFIECPSGHRLKVPSKLAGHSIVCPVCEERISVPPLAAPPKPMLRPVSKKTKPVEAAGSKIESPPEPTLEPRVSTPAGTAEEGNASDNAPPKEAAELQEQARVEEELAAKPETAPEPPTQDQRQPPPFSLDLPSHDSSITQRVDYEHSIRPPTTPQRFEDDYDRPYIPEPQASFPSAAESIPSDVYESGSDEQPESEVAEAPYAESSYVELDYAEPGYVEPGHEEQPYVTDDYDSEQVRWIQVDADPAPKSSRKNLRENQYFGVVALGIAAIMVALFCAIPSVIDQVLARQVGINSPDNWTYIVLLGSLVQIAVAIYAMRLPDWSTSWIASITATAFAAMYALGLALTMFASQEHQLVQELGLLDEAFRYQAQPWCFLVMCITLILAFCYGRFSLRWYHLEQQLAHVG